MKARIKNTGEMAEVVSSTDWESLRHQYAGMAMLGVMNFFGSIDYNKETIARLAVEQADALVEQLKKERQ